MGISPSRSGQATGSARSASRGGRGGRGVLCQDDERPRPGSTARAPFSANSLRPGRGESCGAAREGAPLSTARRILRRMAPRSEIIQVAGREVTVTHPDKVFFPAQIGGERTVGGGNRDQDR